MSLRSASALRNLTFFPSSSTASSSPMYIGVRGGVGVTGVDVEVAGGGDDDARFPLPNVGHVTCVKTYQQTAPPSMHSARVVSTAPIRAPPLAFVFGASAEYAAWLIQARRMLAKQKIAMPTASV